MLCLSGNAAALQNAAAVAVSAASSLGSVIFLKYFFADFYLFLDEFPSPNPTGGSMACDPAELSESD